MEYFHVVFTLPAALGPLALQNPRVVYNLLFRTAAETLLYIAADPGNSGLRSASWPSSTPEGRTSSTTPMCIVLCLVAGSLSTARNGSRVVRASSCRSGC